MDGVRIIRQGPPVDADGIYYPETEDEPVSEMPFHVLAMAASMATLRWHFRDRPDWYVIGNVFWYYERGNIHKRRSPDLMLVKGVDPGAERRGVFKDWEEKARPCFVMEILSWSTKEEDLETKHAIYQQLGVREYFLFDPMGDKLDVPLKGYRLISRTDNGDVIAEFEPLIPFADGTLPSAELGLYIKPEQERLVFVDPRTNERLPDLPETSQMLQEAREELIVARERLETEHREAEEARRLAEQEQQRAEQERQRAEHAQRLAEQERQRAEAAQRRLEEEQRRAEDAHRIAQEAQQKAAQERQAKEEAERRAAALADRLRALGIDPES